MRSLPVLLLLLASCGGRFRLDPRTPYEVLRTPSTVTFAEGVTGRMEVTYPEHRSHGPYPTVVLVPGAGPVDVDGTLESGLGVVRWALDPTVGVWLLVAVFGLRMIASTASVAGGGVGGLFIPLVVAGALLGRAVGGFVESAEESLYAVVGIAAFLSAGYRVPLAAIMFVAETTGRPSFVVPGVIAAVAAELSAGKSSITAYQRAPDYLGTSSDD